MQYLFATPTRLHVTGRNPWMDSASSPAVPALILGRGVVNGDAPQFGGDMIRQSYETGVQPPS